jgi:hypothetical protein
MPSAWRVHVIGERLRQEGVRAVVRACDVYSLEGCERHAVLDAVAAGHADFPMVLVGGALACHDGIDMDAVVGGARMVAGADDRC